jgi:transcriptional regulator with PAS, ATPase and Fis domain
MAYDYPGNIRELENMIEYAMVVCKNSLIGIEHLPDYLIQSLDHGSQKSFLPKQKQISLKGHEREFLYNALAENNWNRKRTAAQLGIHPTTLWRKLRRLNIELPEQDGRHK